jgi:hypothetical protein
MIYFAAAFLVFYGLFRWLAPPQAQQALDRAATADWVACGLGVSLVAVMVLL